MKNAIPAASVDVEVACQADPLPRDPEATDLTTADLLVEEVSIDGMCGVY